ncbi:MAG: hypothetical protein N0E59_12320 [Candidatus Thiodiazotropha taylori]|nr:hypothetical protein [Candidatus Thiodiazotropha taylori]MCG8094191.1 hypothetical protein [Candidatus Thiodiazotropha endolucinida]MCG8028103.1 hypothetical protein [Candidatus Thiodiazotropha taylori]MCG8107548.1 hypothetical protein [Candidatus Thiodiazotropha taylori]MCG8111538.1 hypothetical protein [Candidatus Thiodiazotropha taylori]
MKGILRIACLLGLPASLLLSSKAALSTESTHYVGLTYVTGTRDARERHEDNIDLHEFGHGASVTPLRIVLLEFLQSVSKPKIKPQGQKTQYF